MDSQDKKKILLVTNAFYPEISPRSFRATELAKEFCRQGHKVVVYTKLRDHDYTGFLKEHDIKLRMLGKSRFPKIPDFKHKPFSVIGRIISRLLLILFEYPAIEDMFKIKRYLKKENSFNLMISFAVPFPVHWGVAWSRTRNHKIADTWVADCGDPYMGDVLDSFKKLFYFAYLEKWFCRKADYISIPVESAIPAYYPEFHHKIRIIPQGFNFDLNINGNKHINHAVPEFAYAGGFLQGIRDPGQLLQYLSTIEQPFKFHVYTNQPEMLGKYKEILKGKLYVYEYIPRDELLKVLSNMDFLINFDNNTSLNVPSKLIDYALTNRPVLNINIQFIPENFRAFLNKDYSEKMKLPEPERYHIRNVSKKFLDLIKIENSNK
ncbi:MAG: hypothetical protein JXB00_08660 [Bacteroidales bacterium]|nr:hypothetical protein [Bacteroidales bacterium]